MFRMALLTLLSCFYTCLTWSQACPPGIPSEGNPECLPPDNPDSPYYQGATQQQSSSQPQAVWADRWGAIAMADTGQAGTAEGQESKSQAEHAALNLCNARGGQNCEVRLTYHNQCAAVAQKEGGGETSFVGSPTLQKAQQLAMDQCNNRSGNGACKIVYSTCSMAQRIR